MMKNTKFIAYIVSLIILCSCQNYRSDTDMFADANTIFQDYIFESAIDVDLFSVFSATNTNGFNKYTWLVRGTESDPLGIEVVVAKDKKIKPELVLIGELPRWKPYVGSKHRKGKADYIQ